MSIAEVEKILQSLDSNSNHSFSFTTNTSTEKLQLSIKDVGEIKFPVNKTTIKKLIKQATPALFGHKEKTIYDPKVRNTWELDKSGVKIDMRKWKHDLSIVLDQMAEELFPDGTVLTAELHNMLIYEPGQFFKKHQDTEKTADMQASLVVMLPTKEGLKGGNLAIEHTGQKKVYGKKKDDSSVLHVGFYADCVHEVSKVNEGHRLALTFNVSVKSKGVTVKECPPALIEAVKGYFKSPLKSRYSSVEESSIFCILSHQHTPKSLSWNTLKGNDIAPAFALKAAAENLGLEVYLGSFEYKVTYEAEEDGYGYYSYRNRRYEDTDKASDYTTGDLISDEWSWMSCIDVNGKKAQTPDCSLYDANKIELGDLDELEVEEEDYEGYMGNYGNTLDRLYHRAGIVIRDPQAKAFKKIISAPLKELGRIERLKDENIAHEQLERYFPYVQSFPVDLKVIERIISICNKFESPKLLRQLISDQHFHLLFELPAQCLASLDAENKKVIDEMMQEVLKKHHHYRTKAYMISLLKTCNAESPLCKRFIHLMPNFVAGGTENVKDEYCFDREKHTEQVNHAAMILDFALHAECFNQALPLLKHIEQHPLTYPAELLVLKFPPNPMRLGVKNLANFYQNCLKELKVFVDLEILQDAGAATIPVDDFCVSSTPSRNFYTSSINSEKCRELLLFLRSGEVETTLQLFKKDQDYIVSIINRYRLPVKFKFDSVASRYHVTYKKDLITSKAVRKKRLQTSQKAIALLEV